VLVTATELDRFLADFLEGATLFQVAGGSLEAMGGASGAETGEASSGAPSP